MWGSESKIYAHKVRKYVCAYVRTWWVTLRNVTQNVVTYHRYRPYGVTHSLTHSYTLDSNIDHKRQLLWWWRWRSGTTAWRGHRGLDTTNSFYSKRNTYHVITFTPPHELSSGIKSNLVCPHFHLQILVISKAGQISCLNLGWAEPENRLVPEGALRLCKYWMPLLITLRQ